MEKNTRNSAIIGVVILVILGIAIVISSYSLYKIRDEVGEQEKEKEALMIQVVDLEKTLSQLQSETNAMQSTEADALKSAIWILAEKGVLKNSLENTVNTALRSIASLKPSEQKTATIAAMITAVRDTRFRLGGHSLGYGMDSPGYANFVMGFIGKKVEKQPNVYLSDSMMQQYAKVETPQVGDLMFFDGNPGNFVLFYAGQSDSGGPGIGVGHLSKSQKAGIYDTKGFSGKFLGYYRY